MLTRTAFTITAASWSKTSFAVTMLRLGSGWVKWAVWFIMVTMNIAMGLNAMMIGFTSCTPVQKSWSADIEGHLLAPHRHYRAWLCLRRILGRL
ncbi:hypothetical protein B0H67DRAFT_321675 [Lasiosphaeris hirsuta]|uniref:Rhodopsin domain-containing protein n=1 Tax=Lasiosphaeris hirsuta TaxID=260670 RepID=A0AA40A1Y3_9PEZI|nr:hypothetical protein B0H67DRAFT_321675 [Lasiosphaeris hirsuta]